VPRRLIKNSKLTNRQLNELVKYFALEVPASRAAKVMSINRHSAERVYHVIRRCLARECELNSPLGGEVECDESYFGGRRKGPRGRGAAGKVPVFGLLKRYG
jgi:transposase